MFIHKLEGPWLKHPFWRKKFVIDDPETLADLRDSEIEAVIIDISRGCDLKPRIWTSSAPLTPLRPVRPPRFQPRAVGSVPEPAAFNLRSTQPLSSAKEFGHANKLAARGRKIVSQVFLEARLGKSIKASAIEPVIDDIFVSIQRNPHAFNGLMRCKQETEWVYRHALACSALMITLAQQLKLSPSEIREAGQAGLLFDIGLSRLPIDMAQYQDDLRGIPWEILHEHAALGYNFLHASGLSERTAQVALHHHERNDGAGYPAGLIGSDICLLARMAAVCDAYDELVSPGSDARPVDPGQAIHRMSAMKGRFDPVVLNAFIQCIGVYPIGSFVELRSERLAMVVDLQDDPGRPKVRTFYSLISGERIRSEQIDLAICGDRDEIIGPADLSRFEPEEVSDLRQRMINAVMRTA